jgi:hypothetical protein
VVVALAAKTRIALSDEAADEGALGEGEEGEESGEGAEEGGDTSEERSE